MSRIPYEQKSMGSLTVQSDEGSIEAGLVLIPLTFLFLAITQLIVLGSWQTVETARLHDQLNRIVIANPGSSSEELRNAIYRTLDPQENNQGKEVRESRKKNPASLDVEIDEAPQGKIISVVKEIPIPIFGPALNIIFGDGPTIRIVTVVHAD